MALAGSDVLSHGTGLAVSIVNNPYSCVRVCEREDMCVYTAFLIIAIAFSTLLSCCTIVMGARANCYASKVNCKEPRGRLEDYQYWR